MKSNFFYKHANQLFIIKKKTMQIRCRMSFLNIGNQITNCCELATEIFTTIMLEYKQTPCITFCAWCVLIMTWLMRQFGYKQISYFVFVRPKNKAHASRGALCKIQEIFEKANILKMWKGIFNSKRNKKTCIHFYMTWLGIRNWLNGISHWQVI